MNEDNISDIWMMFKEYIDKKQIEVAAEKYVDLLADYGVDDLVLREVLGDDAALDAAIQYYLDIDNDTDEDYEDEYED